ncbi:MAG: PAS domain S-box protein [Desulfarculaceae bacterium]|nr:PAS domain S-box protein [Desulfarculaceae bacterium]
MATEPKLGNDGSLPHRLILESVGEDTLTQVASDYLDLLGTAAVIHEKNGSLALSVFASDWCRLLCDAPCLASQGESARQSPEETSCWDECSRRAMETGGPVEVACQGGLELFGVPIMAGEVVVGAISFAHGQPPEDPAEQARLAEAHSLDPAVLQAETGKLPPKSPAIVERAKRRLATSARLIGSVVQAELTSRALRENEEKFRLLTENMSDIVWTTDLAFQTTYMSPSAEWVLGFSSQEREALTLEQKITPESVRKLYDLFKGKTPPEARGSRPGDPLKMEMEYYRKDGSTVLMENIITAMHDSKGEIIGFHGVSRDITERKKAQEELTRREETLRGIFDTVQAGIILVDDQGVITLANPRMAQMLGVRQAELIGTPYLGHVAQDQIPHADRAMRQLMAGEVDQASQERLYRRADGSRFWGHLTGQRLHHADGSFWALVGVIQDITERRRADKAIRKSEARFRQLVENISEVFWVGSPDWQEVSYVSPSYEQVWGRSRQGLYDEPTSWMELLPDEDRQAVTDYIQAADPGQPGTFPLYRLQREDGETRWISARYYPVRDESGKVVSICGIAEDITRQKQAEQELRQTLERLKSHLENSPLGVVEFDSEYKVIYWSPQAEEIFGWKAEEMLGRFIGDVRFIHEDDADQVYRLFKEMESGHLKSNTNFNRNYRKDGTVIDCAWYNSAPLDENGELISVFCSVLDITERKRDEQRLKDSEERYRLLFQSMLSGFSLHEIITDDDGKPVDYTFLEMNPAFERFTGLKAEEVRGRTVREVWPDIEDSWIETYGEVALTGRPARFDDYSQALGRHFEVAAYSPAPGQFATVFQDVSERKQAEEALKQSEEKFRSAFDNAGVGMALVDMEGYFLSANSALCEMLGYDPEEFRSLRFLEISHPDDRAESWDQVKLILKGGPESFSLQKRYLHKDGRIIWGRANVSLVRGTDGEPLFAVVQIADITETKEAQEELAEIFNMSLDPICVADINSATFLKVNPAFTATLGYSEQELLGVSFMEFVHPDDVQPTLDVLEKELSRGNMVINFTNRYRRKDGEYVWLNWNSHPDMEKGITYAVAHDITEQRRYERELEEREALLNEVGSIAKIGGWEMDLVTRRSKWTKGTYDIVEIEPGQPIPGPDDHIAFYLPQYRDIVREAMRALEEDDVPLDFEAEALTPKGNVKWCRALGRAQRVGGKAVRLYGTFQDITERKKAEEELHESEQKFRLVTETIQDVFWLSTCGVEEMIYVSPAYENVWGLSLEELYRSPRAFLESLHPDDKEGYLKTIGEYHRRGKAYECSYRILRKGGEIRWIEEKGYPVAEPSGRTRLMTGVCTDITERKKAEEALRESRLWLETIFNAQEDAIFVTTPGRRTVQVNPAAGEMFGYSDQELFERSTELVHVDQAHYEEFGRRITQAFERGETAHFEYEMMRKNGEVFPTEHTVSMLKSELGEPMGILSVVRDITQRKRAEEALAQTQERFRQLMEQSPSVIEIYDLDGTQIMANRAYEELWGFPASHTKGRFNLFKSEEFLRLGLEPYARRAYEGEAVDIPPYRFDGTGPTEGRGRGRTRWLKTRLYPLKDGQGRVQNLVITHEDYTEVKEAEQQNRELEAQLRQSQKLEAVGTLAGGIAHDFNNILAAIMGYAELTQDDLPAGHPGHESIEQILKATRRARDLTRQVLNFSRPGEEHQRPMQLAVLVRETLKLLRPSIPAYVDFRSVIRDEKLMIKADQSQMHQVLLNLCTNAAQALNEGGVIEVGLEKVELDPEDPQAPPGLPSGVYQMLWVKDNGPGMEQGTLARIFDPFFTTKEPGMGSGMGLSVVHGIVQAHDGAVAVESELGQGSVFRVYLPVLSKGELSGEAAPDAPPRGSEHVLLVDDEPALVDVGRHVLERLGYRVTAATSSREALGLFQEAPGEFDLLLTDLTMPGLTGTALAERILAIRPDMPVILCTGYSYEHVTEAQMQAMGIRRLAHKPLRAAEIAEIIREVLDEPPDRQ